MNQELRKIGVIARSGTTKQSRRYSYFSGLLRSARNDDRHLRAGFVLLFSLLVSSILLATGLGISRIMIRQISLASLSRESQIAFFAADSGLECALHWDVFGKFNPTTPPTPEQIIYCNGAIIKDGLQSEPIGIVGATAVTCNSDEPPVNNIITGDTKSCFTFSLSDSQGNKQACAFVIVDKSDPTGTITKITSNGYNKCSLNSPNILQRTLEITLLNE